MSAIVLLNGRFLPAEQAALSVWDGGWLHGAGLFETMQARHGRVFRLDAHLDRLMASAGKLLFAIERPDLPLTSDFAELLERNGLTEARVRLTASAGPVLGGEVSSPDERGDRPRPTVCATAVPLTRYPEEVLARGMAVSVSPFKVSPDDPLAGHKCISYFPRLLALRDAHAKKCGEALWFTTTNLLSEGSISNVFIVSGDKLLTPPVETPTLPGITRAAVLELATAGGIETHEKPLTINDLLDADEAFLANSIMEVMPVCRVERREIGKGKPGPMTRRLMEEYRQLVEVETRANG
jgi:branched-chain amino acid aminotransferase